MKREGRYPYRFASPVAILVTALIPSALFAGEPPESPSVPAIWSVIPFVMMLLSIAILPVMAEHWWHSNLNKLLVAIGLSLPVAAYMVLIGRYHDLEHQMVMDYIPFITLLAALFYISGGIVLRGDIPATPLNNTIFLSVGSLLSSFIGTTGASMLLIRPLLKSNSERKHVVHTVIFFIFLVSNIGGLLTPLGDPPLFLGYLKGVPFTWTLNLTREWLFIVGLLLFIYYVWDVRAFRTEEGANIVKDETFEQPISLKGHTNFFWLIGVIFVVAFVNENYEPFRTLIAANPMFSLIQVPLLILLMALSKITTKGEYRTENSFSFYPIQEVAFLFIGIFITMVPALILLRENGEALGISEPFHYFVGAGIFSSFLDNAPTYLVFLSLAQGTGPIGHVIENMPLELAAISMGAVFWGAVTYIGNAPNFMVKSIAEENRVRMPGFFRYMVYSVSILIPIFMLIGFIFLI